MRERADALRGGGLTMEIHEQRHGAVKVLRPQGPLIQTDADAVRTRLLEELSQTMGRLVLDASAIPYVDSCGLEVLVDVTDEMSKSGQALKLCCVNDTVREVLDLTDLASMFEQFE